MDKDKAKAEIAKLKARLNEIDEEDRQKITKEKYLEKLMMELSIRADNNYCGSNLGGDPSLLYFLISHDVELNTSLDNDVHISDRHNSCILIEIPISFLHVQGDPVKELKEIRTKLSVFFSSHPHKKTVTQEQLVNPSWLRDNAPETMDTILLITACEKAKALKESLEPKEAILREVNTTMSVEKEAIKVLFLREKNLPDNTFSKDEQYNLLKEKKLVHLGKMMNGHPVYGQKLKDISKRQDDILKALLSEEDRNNVRDIDCYPKFAKLISMRVHVGIETIVRFNLDDFMINKLED